MDELLDSKFWYLGQMSREDVETLLKQDDVPAHTHLVRTSKNVPEYIISYKKSGDGIIAHRKISFQNGRYFCTSKIYFSSVVELVEHHAFHEDWVLYDKFSRPHGRLNVPPDAVPVAVACHPSGSVSSCDGTSLDSGSTDNSEASSCTPLKEDSMIVKLRRLLQNTKNINKDQQTGGIPANACNIRAEVMKEKNPSSAGINPNTALTGELAGEPLSEFYGKNGSQVNITVTSSWLKDENSAVSPVHGDLPCYGRQNVVQTPHCGNTVGSQVIKIADPVPQRNSCQKNKILPAMTGCSSPPRIETQEDLSDWSLNVADVRKEGLLGAGNFGQVWKVVHVKSNRIFAMKTMKAATMKWAEFEREVRVMMTFRHPNLVKTYAVGSDPEKSFILIDFLTNGSVIDYSNAVRRREKNPLSCTRKYGIASDVLKGMRYLCEENLIHRDLAARNVLLADDFTAKVADFGLALLADTDGTKDGHRDSMGTPWMWTAPEALRGRNRWSSKCDVWSYGVFCWELYTNCERYPYQDEVSNSRELDQFLKSGRRLKVPDSCHIAQLLAQCWTFDPESRPSFQELHSSFRALGPPEFL